MEFSEKVCFNRFFFFFFRIPATLCFPPANLFSVSMLLGAFPVHSQPCPFPEPSFTLSKSSS